MIGRRRAMRAAGASLWRRHFTALHTGRRRHETVWVFDAAGIWRGSAIRRS